MHAGCVCTSPHWAELHPISLCIRSALQMYLLGDCGIKALTEKSIPAHWTTCTCRIGQQLPNNYNEQSLQESQTRDDNLMWVDVLCIITLTKLKLKHMLCISSVGFTTACSCASSTLQIRFSLCMKYEILDQKETKTWQQRKSMCKVFAWDNRDNTDRGCCCLATI